MTEARTPVLVLVGRPNVGKSTLFNSLTRSRDALVADYPGLTRDRRYGIGRSDETAFVVVDTGGVGEGRPDEDVLWRQVESESFRAVDEADVVLFLVDARAGLTASDETIAERLRRSGRPVLTAVNKAEGVESQLACAEFQSLGFEHMQAISAAHGQRIRSLLSLALELSGRRSSETGEQAPVPLPLDESVKLAVVGRPNVGKSTLVNRWLGCERSITADAPGTTRDSVYIPFERDGTNYTLIDTAGVRRRGRVNEAIEKFSIIKTLQAMAEAHVVVLVADARQGIVEQDANLLGQVVQQGRALVIAVNKWDRLGQEHRRLAREALHRRLDFASYADVHYISALHGSQVGSVLASAARAYESANRDLATPELTRVLEAAVQSHQPPMSGGLRAKLRFAHQGGKNPPLIVVHGNRTQRVPESYRRYLINTFRKAFDLKGTPVQVRFRGGDNPYVAASNAREARRSRPRKS